MKLTPKLLIIAGLALVLPGAAQAATISLSPSSQTVKVGETFTVAVKLDTEGASIDGVDIHYLSFDPKKLQVIDGDQNRSGIQIAPGTLMPNTIINTVDNTTGKIDFSQVVMLGSKYKGSDTVATIQFKATAPGSSALAFNFTPKSTTDTNVAANVGQDLLTRVVNGTYTISGTAAAGTPAKGTQKPSNATVTNPGTTVNDQTNTTIPTGDDSAFQYSEKKSFWQIILSLIVDTFNSFKNRLMGVGAK